MVPMIEITRKTPGIERTMRMPVWRTRGESPRAIRRPMSSSLTSSATVP